MLLDGMVEAGGGKGTPEGGESAEDGEGAGALRGRGEARFEGIRVDNSFPMARPVYLYPEDAVSPGGASCVVKRLLCFARLYMLMPRARRIDGGKTEASLRSSYPVLQEDRVCGEREFHPAGSSPPFDLY